MTDLTTAPKTFVRLTDRFLNLAQIADARQWARRRDNGQTEVVVTVSLTSMKSVDLTGPDAFALLAALDQVAAFTVEAYRWEVAQAAEVAA